MSSTRQLAWAVVGFRGTVIVYDNIRSRRRAVIDITVKEFDYLRTHPRYAAKWTNLTPEQFWRKLKITRHLSVKRIAMKVVR